MTRIGYVQFTPLRFDIDGNMERALGLLERSLEGRADLLVFPELALTGYAYADRETLGQVASEALNARTKEFAREVSRRWADVVVLGYPQWTPQGFYNSAMVVSEAGLVGNYQKTHLFGAEGEVYLPGTTGFPVFETSFGPIGVMICFDWFFPESARTLALAGARIIAHPSNLVMPYCQRAMFARSLENMVFTVTANRCGSETWGTPLTFTGGSIIYGPRGEVLAEGPLEEDTVEVVTVDTERAAGKTLNSRNNIFRDRRTGMYALEKVPEGGTDAHP